MTEMTDEEKRQQELDYGLILATSNNYKLLIDLLLENGANINVVVPPKSYWQLYESCMSIAIKDRNLFLAKYLLSKGALINNPISNECAPLVNAINNYDVEAVKFLLENGASAHGWYEKPHQTFLDRCINRVVYSEIKERKELLQITQLLLDHGANFKKSISVLEKKEQE